MGGSYMFTEVKGLKPTLYSDSLVRTVGRPQQQELTGLSPQATEKRTITFCSAYETKSHNALSLTSIYVPDFQISAVT